MKKIGHSLLGVVIGSALTLSASVAAEEIKSLIGKRIDGEFVVTLDDQELPVKAGTIEGTSYLPVRAVSEALNLEVSFDQEAGISLKKKEAVKVENDLQVQWTQDGYPRPTVEFNVSVIDSDMQMLKTTMERFPEKNTPENQQKLAEMEAELRIWKERLAELDAAPVTEVGN